MPWYSSLREAVIINSPGYIYPEAVTQLSFWSLTNKIDNITLQLSSTVLLKQPPGTIVLNWQSLYQHCCILIVYQIHKCVLQLVPACLSLRFVFNQDFGYHTWGGDKIHQIYPFTRNSLQFKGAQLYNLPSPVCHLRNLSAFKCNCVMYFCNQRNYSYDFSCIYLIVCFVLLIKH